MGCYIAFDNASTKEDVIADINRRTLRAGLIVDGEFNENLLEMEVTMHTEDVAVSLTTHGLD